MGVQTGAGNKGTDRRFEQYEHVYATEISAYVDTVSKNVYATIKVSTYHKVGPKNSGVALSCGNM